MGKKVKVGKSRKDKFYQLAKETGYRARSAFKLLQLNRKYEFLQKSRVCVDLCAAPGGWLQVAANHMPMSSIIVGVDLVPIRAIPRVITLVDDITTDKCRQDLKKELQTWKADVVLHDGAPNVGKNWLHDAFVQAELTLSALRLAIEFLRKGGWFITKVFRSKDYQSLMWVFQQLFKHVYATKPQASRNESAEIFVTCQGFLAPDKIDPKFTDPKYVFKEVGKEGGNLLNLMHPEKQKKHAEGYADGDYTLHHRVPVSKFIASDNHMEILADCNELVFDDDQIKEHPLTTAEILECCKDIKVLGKKDIRILMNWRKKLNKELAAKSKPAVQDVDMESAESEDEDAKIERQIEELQAEQMLDEKRKKKQVLREKRKLREKMNLNMIIPGDRIEETDDIALFDIKRIKNKHGLKEVEKDEMSAVDEVLASEEADSDEETLNRKKTISYDRHKDEDDEISTEESENENSEDEETSEDEDADMEEDEMEVEEEEGNPLVVDLAEVKKTKKQAQLWFKKDAFAGLEGDDDEDLEIKNMTEEYKRKGGVVLDTHAESKTKRKRKRLDSEDMAVDTVIDSGHESDDSDLNEKNGDDHEDESSDSDEDSNYDSQDTFTNRASTDFGEDKKRSKGGFEIVKSDKQAHKVQKLDPIELAIGEELIKSSKRRREIIEDSYNRNQFDDDGLPEWFVTDERKYRKKSYPVTKEQIQEYKDRMKAIDARPIKKVAEAKGRKKRKALKKMERIRKKAETISDTVDVSDREKMHQIKQLYKKAGVLKNKKEEVTYVVGKKGVGKRVSRPAGVKGRFKVVDPRMKKDKTKQKMTAKTKGKDHKKFKGKFRK